MFDSPDFDLAPYAEVDLPAQVRRTYCSWSDAGWRSLLVQCFDHAPEAEPFPMPAVADLHLVLCVGGDVEMRTRADGKPVRRRWVPGTLELMVPGLASVRDYRTTSPLRTVQVTVPSVTVEQVAEGRTPDFPALTADPLVEQLVRALPPAAGAGDLYAESAAAFLVTHLLTGGRHERLPGPEHAAVRRAVAEMRERLAEPLTVAEIAAEAHLSVYHFIRVFRDATGETPHRFLTRLRIERARRLLSGTDLTVAQIADRCGFASPGALSTAFLGQVGVRPSVYRKN
ncbi:helix-turn-helix domain-containing protein [Amycolatopsis sp. 195334CR]|uniref:helix-turn-helix domain-containing protein n=1 Tax=Amycolatopsis sp. 195334CR TaxID=2814588 RepID=UPI001A8C0A75|nr:AraC family transcriptional regulator [Amycolatopsis sp. 195334CR]MBN6038217.1 helix-turn-helix transcriptional regulator [Amycolatopsis sp. 195334CR]